MPAVQTPANHSKCNLAGSSSLASTHFGSAGDDEWIRTIFLHLQPFLQADQIEEAAVVGDGVQIPSGECRGDYSGHLTEHFVNLAGQPSESRQAMA